MAVLQTGFPVLKIWVSEDGEVCLKGRTACGELWTLFIGAVRGAGTFQRP